MKLKEVFWSVLFYLFLTLIFFHKIFLGYVSFPGDLLVSRYQPWRSSSYLGYISGSYPTKEQYFDVIRQIYPWKTESLSQIKNGQIPFWNPYNFSGSPLLANNQSAVFYPLNFLYFLTSQINAWTILIFLQPLLAALFTYLFCRNLNLSKSSSIVSGLAYGFSLFMSVFLEYNTIGHVILWLPLIFLSTDKIIFQNKMKWKIIFVFSLCSSLFAGHLQISAYVIFFNLLYLFFRIFNSTLMIHIIRVKLILFAFLFGMAVILTMPQWLLTFQLIQESARSPQNYSFLINQLLIQPRDLLRFFSPDIFGNPAVANYLLNDSYPGKAVYIGLLPLIFSLLSLWQFKKNQLVKFFSLSFFIIFFFLFRWPLTEWFYKIQIPLFSTSSPSNVIFLLSFCLAVLAGYGMEIWQKNDKKIIIPYFLILCLSLMLLFYPGLVLVKNNLYYSLILIVGIGFIFLIKRFWRKGFISKLVIFGLIGLTAFDLYYFFNKFNPFVPTKLVYPEAPVLSWLKKNAGINRIWGYGTANIEGNFFTQEKLFSADGYDPLYPKRYGEFIQSSRDGKIKTKFDNITRSDAFIANGFGETDMKNNAYREKILNVLGVKYILDRIENGSTQQTFPPEKYKLIYQDENGWKIFENLKVTPRLFLTSDYKVFKTKEEFAKLFFVQDFNPGKTILLEENPVCVKPDDSNHQAGSLGLKSYKENKIEVKTETQNCQLLFLSDTYFPGWKTFIDGKETKIYRADYAFRAVVIPSGSHEVIFSYEPQSFYLGTKISIISLIAFLLFLGFAI